LLRARVAREEAAALELATQVRIGLQQRARDAVAQRAGLRRDAAAVQLGDHVHALLVADRLERLADVALERGAREEGLERLAVDDVRAGARLQRHARDRRLALARGGVAGAGRKRDRRVGDRLRLRLLVALGGGSARLVVLVVRRRLAAERVAALGDDVGHEVRAGDLRLDARRLLDQLLLGLLLGGRGGSRGLLRGRSGLGRLVGDRLRLRCGRLRLGGGLLGRRLGVGGALLVLWLLDVGHEA